MVEHQGKPALRKSFLCMIADHPDEDPANILPDGRFNHIQQVQERLKFLRYLYYQLPFMVPVQVVFLGGSPGEAATNL